MTEVQGIVPCCWPFVRVTFDGEKYTVEPQLGIAGCLKCGLKTLTRKRKSDARRAALFMSRRIEEFIEKERMTDA